MRTLQGIILIILMLSITAWAQLSKIDPQIYSYVLSADKRASAEKAGLLKQTEGGRFLETIVTMQGSPAALEDAGSVVRWRRGDLVIAQLPFDRLREIASLPEIRYIEAINRARLTNDISVLDIGAVQARQTTGLTGKGVLIGIIDSGIDFHHRDFRKSDGSTRIKYLLDLNTPGLYYGGTIYSENDINSTLSGIAVVKQKDQRGHGSHVAGIAAGDGTESDGYGAYAGVAPEADLIIVKAMRTNDGNELFESDQLIALGFIDSVATALGQPCVANLSFGSDLGAHDGTTAVERYIDTLSGNGKVFIVSAGNQGDNKYHASATVTGGSREITFKVAGYSAQFGPANDLIFLDGWYEGTGQVSITIISPSDNSYGPLTDGNYREWNTQDGHILILNGFFENGPYYEPGVNPFNYDKEILILISDEGTSSPPAEGTWTIRMSGNAGGDVHFWLADASMEVEFDIGLDMDMTLSMPGTARSAITVGAYTTRDTWKDMDGNNLTIDTQGTIRIGDIAAFSGAGPTRDDRVKPEITAPGQIIASTYSIDAPAGSASSIFLSPSPSYPNAFIMPDSLHGLSLGTSMAAPFVTGVCALLLEKYPDADAAKIKQLLTYTAKAPSFSGNSNQWGFGKLDAYRAVITDINTLPDSTDTTSQSRYEVGHPTPNPCSGGTKIKYTLPQDANTQQTVTLKIYNRIGQMVRRISRISSPGVEDILFWDCRDRKGRLVANGVYFLEFRSGSFKKIQKVTVIYYPQ